MTIDEAREIIANDHKYGSWEIREAKGYKEAWEQQQKKIEILKKALRYCSTDPRLLHPQNNMQCVVAMNALSELDSLEEK